MELGSISLALDVLGGASFAARWIRQLVKEEYHQVDFRQVFTWKQLTRDNEIDLELCQKKLKVVSTLSTSQWAWPTSMKIHVLDK